MDIQQTMINKVVTMLEMQDAMNRKVDEDWLERDREWYRAVWIECAELMDHYGGWKWWKASQPDIEQVMLEIVDIWHFGLSMQITAARDFVSVAERLMDDWHTATASDGFLHDVEAMAAAVLSDRRFPVAVVKNMLTGIERDFDDLFAGYVGKNVLNFFRQDHGYKQGDYIKVWDGKEDNVHLVEIMQSVDLDSSTLQDDVYQHLNTRYKMMAENSR